MIKAFSILKECVRNSRLYNSIKKALLGSESEIKNEMYTSYTSGETKYINFYIYPIYSFSFNHVEEVIIMFNDISEEILLKDELIQIIISYQKVTG